MANILITGANGQLGCELRGLRFSLLDELFFTDVNELDITDKKAVFSFVEANDIDTIVNCAAYTAVDRAEEEAELAGRINREGAANLAKAAYELGCLLIHISTDYVFNGEYDQPYTEKDPTDPRTVYGMTKLEGERAIRKSGCLYIIIRTGWLYSTYGNNFVKTILRLSQEKKDLSVVGDQYGTPTYARDLAVAIQQLLESDDLPEFQGIYHYSDEGCCTWFDFATEILRLSGSDCHIKPVTTDQYPTPARRPAYSVLDKTKIKKIFALEIPDWKDSLQQMLKTLREAD